MAKWKKIVNQKGNYWWQVGENKLNKNHLPKKWVHVGEKTPYVKKEFGYSWEVRSYKRINKKTIYGNSRFFKTKKGAMDFARRLMK